MIEAWDTELTPMDNISLEYCMRFPSANLTPTFSMREEIEKLEPGNYKFIHCAGHKSLGVAKLTDNSPAVILYVNPMPGYGRILIVPYRDILM